MIAHNGSGLDSYIVLNIQPQWRSVVILNKIGAGISSLEINKGYVDQNKKTPQYLHFRCGNFLFRSSLRKIGVSYKSEASLFKQELEYDEIYEDSWEHKEGEWLTYFKNEILSTAFCYAG